MLQSSSPPTQAPIVKCLNISPQLIVLLPPWFWLAFHFLLNHTYENAGNTLILRVSDKRLISYPGPIRSEYETSRMALIINGENASFILQAV